MKRTLLALALVVSGCVPSESAQMDPGKDCMACHSEGGTAPAWTAAGTVYATPDAPAGEGLRHVWVELTDAKGKTVTRETNPAGNFYTSEPLVFPIEVAVRQGNSRIYMPGGSMSGACNSCHQPASTSEPGRVFFVP